jgi:hypothetical protein
VDHWIAPAGKPTGRQSSFQPAPDLASLELPAVRYHPGELVRLKDVDGHLIGYRDTERTIGARRHLEELNEAIDGMALELVHPAAEFDGPVLRCGRHVAYPLMHSLYRVFNGSWKWGGRLYGGWWQQLSKELRACLAIDGELPVELDFAQLHAQLVYSLAEQPLVGDAYTLAGWDRKTAKIAFNVLLNASTYFQAVAAIAANAFDGDRTRAAELVEAIRQRHAAIAKHFHTGIGLRLQCIDAEMARRVTKALLDKGIVSLPIHDSFIVQRKHEGSLAEIMVAVGADFGVAAFSRATSNT